MVKLVSSTLLWQKFLSETQASAPFQKLRKNWLLILQIILLKRPTAKGRDYAAIWNNERDEGPLLGGHPLVTEGVQGLGPHLGEVQVVGHASRVPSSSCSVDRPPHARPQVWNGARGR